MILFDTPGIIDKKRTKLEERMMNAVVRVVPKNSVCVRAICVVTLFVYMCIPRNCDTCCATSAVTSGVELSV